MTGHETSITITDTSCSSLLLLRAMLRTSDTIWTVSNVASEAWSDSLPSTVCRWLLPFLSSKWLLTWLESGLSISLPQRLHQLTQWIKFMKRQLESIPTDRRVFHKENQIHQKVKPLKNFAAFPAQRQTSDSCPLCTG